MDIIQRNSLTMGTQANTDSMDHPREILDPLTTTLQATDMSHPQEQVQKVSQSKSEIQYRKFILYFHILWD